MRSRRSHQLQASTLFTDAYHTGGDNWTVKQVREQVADDCGDEPGDILMRIALSQADVEVIAEGKSSGCGPGEVTVQR